MKSILSVAVAAAILGCAGFASAASHSHRDATAGTTSEPTQAAKPLVASDKFASEAEAKGQCRGDTVVWVNTKTHVYHFAGNAAYGHTKHGAFMCQADADRGGKFHAAKNEAAGSATATTGSTTPARR